MKKAIAFLIGLTAVFSATAAADVSSFVVQVSPTTVNVNEALDLTVRAIDANGNVVKDYAWDIFIDLVATNSPIDSQDYTLPSDGIYTFVASDQWVKTFSKGLVVKKSGTFTIKVSEIINDTIRGETTLVVNGAGQSSALGTVTVSSPSQGSTETNQTINVVGNSSLRNSPLEIYINGIRAKQDITSSNGDFNVYVTNLEAGENTLQVKIVDIDGNEVAISSQVTFTYQPSAEAGMQDFEVLPGTTVKQWQKVTFAFTANGANAVELTVVPEDGSASRKVPLDNVDGAIWKKEYLMDKAGTFVVNASMVSEGTTKTYNNIATLNVVDTKSVQQIKYFVDSVDKSKLQLSWTYLGSYAQGEVPYFLVKYGETKESLSLMTGDVVSGAVYTGVGMDLTKSYYVQVSPVDQNGSLIGEPSDVILIEPGKWSAPVCKVEGLVVITRKIADKYYLTWDKIEGADRYIVYRSDVPVPEGNGIIGMQKVGETSETRFEYPFDPMAEQDTYAYYAVVAMCSDGNALQIGDTNKVKVWPMQNLFFMLLISGLFFGLYKLNVLGRKN